MKKKGPSVLLLCTCIFDCDTAITQLVHSTQLHPSPFTHYNTHTHTQQFPTKTQPRHCDHNFLFFLLIIYSAMSITLNNVVPSTSPYFLSTYLALFFSAHTTCSYYHYVQPRQQQQQHHRLHTCRPIFTQPPLPAPPPPLHLP